MHKPSSMDRSLSLQESRGGLGRDSGTGAPLGTHRARRRMPNRSTLITTLERPRMRVPRSHESHPPHPPLDSILHPLSPTMDPSTLPRSPSLPSLTLCMTPRPSRPSPTCPSPTQPPRFRAPRTYPFSLPFTVGASRSTPLSTRPTWALTCTSAPVSIVSTRIRSFRTMARTSQLPHNHRIQRCAQWHSVSAHLVLLELRPLAPVDYCEHPVTRDRIVLAGPVPTQASASGSTPAAEEPAGPSSAHAWTLQHLRPPAPYNS